MIIVMRSNTQNLLRVLFLVGFVASFAVWQRNEVQFDTFKFTQQWPVAVCVDIDVSIPALLYNLFNLLAYIVYMLAILLFAF